VQEREDDGDDDDDDAEITCICYGFTTFATISLPYYVNSKANTHIITPLYT